MYLRYYCEIASENATSIICPIGHYCLVGSAAPTPCPHGTYSNTEANKNVTACTPCDAGKYCNDTGLFAPSDDCDPGFYCPGGNDLPNPIETVCPIGLHCPRGSAVPQPCDPGTFANFSGAAYCNICPGGFYCVPEEVIMGI